MGQQGQKWQFLADDYIAALEKAGGIPVVLPVVCGRDTAMEAAARIDGQPFCGGRAVAPGNDEGFRRSAENIQGVRTRLYCMEGK